MTTYFMRDEPSSDVAEIVLENGESRRRDGSRLGSQDARPHAHLLEARADGEVLLVGREPALRADEERGGAGQRQIARIEAANG